MSASRFWETVVYGALLLLIVAFTLLMLALTAGTVLGWWY